MNRQSRTAETSACSRGCICGRYGYTAAFRCHQGRTFIPASIFLLRLIDKPAPAHHGRASCSPRPYARCTPVWHPPTAPRWKASPASSAPCAPVFFQFLAAPAVVDDAVNRAVVILQRHFRRAEGIVLLRPLCAHSKGSCAVAHDEVFPIVRLMVNPISRRLHLFPRHIGHTKAASGCADSLLRRHLIRRVNRDHCRPLRLQKLRHLRKAKAVTVMGGVLPVLMQHRNIGHRHRVPLEVSRVVDVKAGIDAFQIILFRQRSGVDQFIVLRLHRKAVVSDSIQRFKAVSPCGVPRFQLVDGKGIAPRLLLYRLCPLRNVGGRLHIGGRLRHVLAFCLFRRGQHLSMRDLSGFSNTALISAGSKSKNSS